MIAIVDYGMGNLRSILKACEEVGAKAVLTSDSKIIETADKIILPGVGAFHDAILALRSSGLDSIIVKQVNSGKPLLGICLGYQLLFDRSFEDGEFEGLGLIKGNIRQLTPLGLKVPHMGWNTLSWQRHSKITDGMKEGEWMYFVHSYAATELAEEDILATTQYGGEVVAAVERGNICGFQFHPEKSGTIGLKLLGNFIN